MSDVMLQQVTDNYYDVLKEIGNIGAGNAMTALSQMLQCKVDMKVPQVRLLEFSEVGDLMGGEEQITPRCVPGRGGRYHGQYDVYGGRAQRQTFDPEDYHGYAAGGR